MKDIANRKQLHILTDFHFCEREKATSTGSVVEAVSRIELSTSTEDTSLHKRAPPPRPAAPHPAPSRSLGAMPCSAADNTYLDWPIQIDMFSSGARGQGCLSRSSTATARRPAPPRPAQPRPEPMQCRAVQCSRRWRAAPQKDKRGACDCTIVQMNIPGRAC